MSRAFVPFYDLPNDLLADVKAYAAFAEPDAYHGDPEFNDRIRICRGIWTLFCLARNDETASRVRLDGNGIRFLVHSNFELRASVRRSSEQIARMIAHVWRGYMFAPAHRCVPHLTISIGDKFPHMPIRKRAMAPQIFQSFCTALRADHASSLAGSSRRISFGGDLASNTDSDATSVA